MGGHHARRQGIVAPASLQTYQNIELLIARAAVLVGPAMSQVSDRGGHLTPEPGVSVPSAHFPLRLRGAERVYGATYVPFFR
jgi:hypothetical protein